MEIDSDGIMWVVDVGRRNFAGDLPDNRCPPKILLFDTQTGQVWAVHPLPLDLNHSTSAFARTPAPAPARARKTRMVCPWSVGRGPSVRLSSRCCAVQQQLP